MGLYQRKVTSSDIQAVLLRLLAQPGTRFGMTADRHAVWVKRLHLHDNCEDTTLSEFVEILFIMACTVTGLGLPFYILGIGTGPKDVVLPAVLGLTLGVVLFKTSKNLVERARSWFRGLPWMGPDDIELVDALLSKEPHLAADIGRWLQVPRTVGEGRVIRFMVKLMQETRANETQQAPSFAEVWKAQVKNHALSAAAAYERVQLQEAIGDDVPDAAARARI